MPLPSLLLRKKDTVIGTIGNTQGVSKATKPHAMASRITAQIDFPPSFLTGATSSAEAAAPVPAGSFTVRISSVGGRQLPSLQVCHSTVTLATGALPLTSTFWPIWTPVAQVPISIPKSSS